MTVRLARLSPPALPTPAARPTGRPSRALLEAGALMDGVWRDVLGVDDMDTAPDLRLPAFADQRRFRKIQVVAVEGLEDPSTPDGPRRVVGAGVALDRLPTLAAVVPGSSADPAEEPTTDLGDLPPAARVVGWLGVQLPLTDNTHLAHVWAGVTSEAQRRGIGVALLDLAREIARGEGRRVCQGWTTHAPAGPDAETVVPATGAGAVPADATTAVLRARGWRLAQVERMSRLDVPGLDAIERRLDDAALATGPAYTVHTFEGPCPPQWREAYGDLRRRMSVDIPSGDLDVEEEVWDAERVADLGRDAERVGTLALTTVAQEIATGALVAYTQIDVEGAAAAPRGDDPAGPPGSGTQEDTFVHGEHRGHGLGLLVKLVNLRELRERRPSVDRLYTWNAGENAHMLAINEALGYREVAVEGAWELTVPGS